jgi:hypothetical protein
VDSVGIGIGKQTSVIKSRKQSSGGAATAVGTRFKSLGLRLSTRSRPSPPPPVRTVVKRTVSRTKYSAAPRAAPQR